jgi:hypothetical protein
MLHYFKRIRDGVEALPRNWVECEIFRCSRLEGQILVAEQQLLVHRPGNIRQQFLPLHALYSLHSDP